MNIGIVTVFDSINCGSYWQAYALGYILRSMGHNVAYLERKKTGTSSNSNFFKFKRILSAFKNDGVYAAMQTMKSIYEFQHCIEQFTAIKACDKDFSIIDCVILGSDTIWNVADQYFLDNWEFFWGKEFANCKIITYAGSVANTDKKIINSLPEIRNVVNNWSCISVRDKHSKEIISSLTKNSIELICDPAMLLTKEVYEGISTTYDFTEHYIFLYLFKRLSERQERNLADLARNSNLIIINGIKKQCAPFSDRTIINSPHEFIKYFLNADFVVTDTFHGSVFSIVLNKKFAAIDRGKNKVRELLKEFNLENCLIGEKEELRFENVNWLQINKKVEWNRKKGISFLKKALE